MILDTGICSVYRVTDGTASGGGMPQKVYTLLCQSWYGTPAFESSPSRPTDNRKELETSARIRILQHREIRQNDVAILAQADTWASVPDGSKIYEITRAYHGQDDDGPTLISDLTLREVSP